MREMLEIGARHRLVLSRPLPHKTSAYDVCFIYVEGERFLEALDFEPMLADTFLYVTFQE